MGLFGHARRGRVEWRATHYLLGILPVSTWTGTKAKVMRTAFDTKYRYGGKVVIERVAATTRPRGTVRNDRITL